MNGSVLGSGTMEVTEYELFDVPSRWLFVRIETDSGLVGWGEHVAGGGPAAVRAAAETLLRTHLLGGPVRDRVRVYQWIGGDRPSEVGDAAERRLAAVREAVGREVDVGVDFHGRVSKPMAKQLAAALEPHDPMFIEEPLLPEHLDALPDLARHTTVPLATGERLFTRSDFKPVLEAGAVDLIQPDVGHAGGITEVRKIAAMAEAADVAMAPHCPLGPVALAACLQVDASTPNALIQEQSLDIHYNQTGDLLDYVSDTSVFEYEDGYVEIPEKPGLGIDVDEAAVRAAAVERPDWGESLGLFKPTWRHDDGSVAEW
jgi:galactonate dehydratase